jgi:hypothetical protein
LLVENTTVRFAIMVLFMLGTYTFMRLNYLAMVMCVTPYVFIVFSFIGTEFRSIASERILDTFIGCAIAFSASYFLFPSWEREQLKQYMGDIVKANMLYLQKIIKALSGHQVSLIEYKVSRRDVYLHSANLSAAFQRMLSEPKSKQTSTSQLQQFVVLNHLFFSNIANMATTLLSKDRQGYPAELLHMARKVHSKLDESRKKLGNKEELFLPGEATTNPEEATDDVLLKEQLQFVYKISKDIEKTDHCYYFSRYTSASSYPFSPSPIMLPNDLPETCDSLRNSSRACTLEICTSTTGALMAAMASPMATDVCV